MWDLRTGKYARKGSDASRTLLGMVSDGLTAQVCGGLWRRVDWVASTGSTNADLVAAARAGEPAGRVLVADYQNAGRGRFDRRWQAPPGAMVAISALLRPAVVDAARWTWLPLVAGLAVADGLRDATGLDARVKWPNDVLVGERKISGILVERTADAAVVGMGVNTSMTRDQLPVPQATSLAVEGALAATEDVVAAILRTLETWYVRWETGEDLADAYAARSATIGRDVRVAVSPDETVDGRAVGVDATGALLVETGGAIRSFAAGDVWHVRSGVGGTA